MANAGCINAISCDGCLIQTLQQLDSSNIGVGVQFTAPNPLDDKRFDYIKYTDKNGNTCCLTGENEILIYATQGTLKNLTLTNDDANEVVNVKRTDIFGSNRKKTVVRYKTGSAPVSITDGTLAVEELVQNQYASTGYNVSGLSDGTTYYFSAFAVAQDDTIIDMQSNSITTEFSRKPGTNTIGYWSLNGNLLDGKGNYNGTAQGTAQYQTIYGTKKGAYFGTDVAFRFINTTCKVLPKTVSFFMKFRNSEATAQDWKQIIGQNQADSGKRQLRLNVGYNTTTGRYDFYLQHSSGTYQVNVNSYLHDTNFHHIVLTTDGTSTYIYIDKVLVGTTSGTLSPAPDGLRIGGRNNAGSYRLNATMGDVILESVQRNQSDITTYYNKVKSQYGIS